MYGISLQLHLVFVMYFIIIFRTRSVFYTLVYVAFLGAVLPFVVALLL